jgi:class 3 adenylate cyclase/TolB-like protein
VPPVERKLAAILSADVVGYSRLMAEDEAETIRTLGAYRTEITHLVEHHRGRVVDFTGDNFLAEFPTALDAVECAVETQRVLTARNASLPANRRMEFRMGVHLGDVAVEDGRLYGDGVNIAARLEGLAEAGGICVSATVHEQVERKLDLDFQDLGDQSIKNIPNPVHAYRSVGQSRHRERVRPLVQLISLGATGLLVLVFLGAVLWNLVSNRLLPVVEPTRYGPPLTSVAVLPFDDMSPDGDQKWLGDGMAEELIEALSRIEALLVIARTSAFAQRGSDIATIGEQLHVGAVVEGSVRQSGDQLRVTAQLIRVADHSHLWSASYDREVADVFAIQRDIAREVAEAIRTELGVSQTKSWLVASRYATPDVRAWELLRKSDERENTWTEEGFRDQITLTGLALEIDPEYAQAHAQHGWGYFWLWDRGVDSRGETLAMAKASVEHALELEPTNGAAHNLLAWLSMRDCAWEEAEARLVRALKATPGHGPLRNAYGWLLLYTGRVEDAAAHLWRAAALDPGAAWATVAVGLLHLVEGDREAAIREMERWSLAWPTAPLLLATAYRLNGEDGGASDVLINAYAPSPGAATAWRATFAEGGLVALSQAILDQQIGLTGRPCTKDPEWASLMLALSGEQDQMFSCLEEGVRLKRPALGVKVNPAFDPYRDDPRFTALLRRMNLAD